MAARFCLLPIPQNGPLTVRPVLVLLTVLSRGCFPPCFFLAYRKRESRTAWRSRSRQKRQRELYQLGRKNRVSVKDASFRRCPFAWRLRRDCSGSSSKSRKKIRMISFFFFFLGRDLWSRFFSVCARVVDASRLCEREWAFLVAGLLWRWSEKRNASFCCAVTM